MKRKTNQIQRQMANFQGIIRHLDLFSQQIVNIILTNIKRIFTIQTLHIQQCRVFYINNFKQIELSRGIL